MFSTEEYNDKIEEFLKGNLSSDKAAEMEAAMKADPQIKSEVLFQKTLIHGIQDLRKAELKARLNSIKVPAQGPNYWRIGAVAAVVTALIVSVNFIPEDLFRSEKAEPRVATTDKLENLGVVKEEEITNQIAAPLTEQEVTAAPETVKESYTEARRKEKKMKHSVSESEISREDLPNLPEVHSPDASGHDHIGKEVETPDHSLTKSNHISASVAAVEVIKSKKHKFHYRYFDNKLFLYGNFETKTYDILELNNSKGQKLYLKFENNYYELEPDKTEISKLESVKSRETLKELEEIQR